MKKCECGCGRLIAAVNGRRFFDKYVCRQRFNKNRLAGGCAPLKEVGFGVCLCGFEFIFSKYSIRTTCSHITGSNCNRVAQGKKVKGNVSGKNNNPEVAKENNARHPHILEYCHKNGALGGECAEYSSCMGNAYAGDCHKDSGSGYDNLLKAGGCIAPLSGRAFN